MDNSNIFSLTRAQMGALGAPIEKKKTTSILAPARKESKRSKKA